MVSPHRGVINIVLNVVGILEYWNIRILGIKSKLGLMSDYLSTHVSYKIDCDPKLIIPLFHHSIIPVA